MRFISSIKLSFLHRSPHVFLTLIFLQIFLIGINHIGNISAEPKNSVTSTRSFIYPLQNQVHIMHSFSPGKHRWNRGHRGVDLPAEPHAIVYAAGEGNITFANAIAGIPIISVKHSAGFITTYEPVIATVSLGQFVHKGEKLGYVHGELSHCTRCLHWGARYFRGHQSRYFDPLVLIGLAHIILKPIDFS